MWPGRSLFATSNALSGCPWRWPNSPSALQSTNRSEAPPWAPLWALLFVWWSLPSRRKSGTAPTALLWPTWTFPLASFVMLTTDCVSQILPGTTKSALPISCTRSSTANPSFWKRNQIRSSWALHWVRTFRTTLQSPTWLQPGYGTILRITFGGAIIRLRITTLFGRQMCAPCPGTDSRFRRIASFVQDSRFLWIRSHCRCQAYLPIFTHFFSVVKSVAALILFCLRLTFHLHVDVSH